MLPNAVISRLPGYTEQEDGPSVSCYCGKHNCVESFVSGSGFSERYQQMTGNLLTPAAIVTLAQRGDACAMQQVARFANSLPARSQPSLMCALA